MGKIKPIITPTVRCYNKTEEGSYGKTVTDSYHYNAGDNPEMLKRWTQYPEQGIVQRVPIQLDIETTSACNLQCPMCPQSSEELRPEKSYLDRALYEHIIDEFAKKDGMSVKLMFRGEPLVRRDTHEWVRYASERGVQAKLNTNGVLMDETRARELIKAGLHQAIFSIDSHIKDEYEAIRRPNERTKGNFPRILENVRGLARLREEMKSKYPLIEVSRVDLPDTREGIPDFIDFWLNNGADYVSILGLLDWTMGKEGKMLASEEFSCEMPWQRMFILADGLVTSCCGDTYQQSPLAQICTPDQIRGLEKRLQKSTVGHKHGDSVELEWISSDKLGKTVIGTVMEEGSVKATKVRVRGITGRENTVPLVDNVEEAWTGSRQEAMRKANETGNAHTIKACADCGYRETTIRNASLPYRIEPRMQLKKTQKTKYVEKGKL
jgi:hypothetical protein